jgi:hypothetical protein
MGQPKPEMTEQFQLGWWSAVKTMDHFAQTTAMVLLMTEAKARGDMPKVVDWGRRRGIPFEKAGDE